MKKLFLMVYTIFMCSPIFATIIKPVEHLHDLAKHCDAIVIAKATQDLYLPSKFLQNPSWNFNIEHSFKGKFDLHQNLVISGIGEKSKNLMQLHRGDFSFDIGQQYLLFLNQTDDGQWIPIGMSYYVFELKENNGTQYWVPSLKALEICVWNSSKTLQVLNAKDLNNRISNSVANNFQNFWSDHEVNTDHRILDFYPDYKVPPGHCTFLFDGSTSCGGADGARWDMFPTLPLEVWVDTEQQTEFPNSNTLVSNGVVDMNANYSGINLLYQGIVGTNYTPNCAGGSAQSSSSNFFPFSNSLNGGDNVLFIFNDPCDQIGNVSPCNGTLAMPFVLAIGGIWASCQGDNHDGLNWLTAQNGYVIFNDNIEDAAGNPCIGNDLQFEQVAIHELSHALGIGHIDAANGTANMNGICCSAITALDQQCLDYLYPPAGSVPVTWLNFEGETQRSSNLLSWQTASEVNNSHFEIEYSRDGKEFDFVSSLTGNGNSSELNSYTFEDDIHLGLNSYYRLKQVDFDGSHSYSDVISLRRAKMNDEVILYPNPATNSIMLLAALENSEMQVTDGLGRIQNLHLQKQSDQNATIDISQLSPGIYYLQLINGEEISVHSFIKN